MEDLQDLFENAPCGYIAAQANGVITRVNRTFAEWMGYEQSYFADRRFLEFLTVPGKIYYETHFAPFLRMQGFFNEVALDLVRADNSVFPVLVNAVERRDDSGEVRFLRITVFNATDRRKYEQELLSARKAADEANARLNEFNATLEARVREAVQQRMQVEDALRQVQKMEAVGQLTGGIAHDFNNMLAVVVAGLDLLQRKLNSGDTDVDAYIDAARDAAHQAAALTHRLLAFSRRQPLSQQVIDANRMVAGMSELLRRTLGETIRLETVLAESLWQVRTDANQLENAVINLAVNARDAMPEGGRLTIETANCTFDEAEATAHAMAAGQYVTIAVADTGCGMAPEVAAKAFEPFFTTKGVGRGTGLGLSQVFGFVKQCGGHVEIATGADRGTKVTIYLPRYDGPADAHIAASSEADIPLGSPSEIILVVEDHEPARRLAVEMLADLGYTVLEAQEASQALQMLGAHPEVKLLFTDVVMPGMSGPQLAEQALRGNPDLKVLFTTGYASSTVLPEGELDPGIDLLPKPASVEVLSRKIRQLLDA